MSRAFRKKIKIPLIIIILGSITIGIGTFFLVKASNEAEDMTNFRNSEAFYAEMTRGMPQGFSTSTSVAIRLHMKVPILVYHIVRPSYPSDSQAVKALAQTPEIFDAQMAYLTAAGYHVIPLSLLEENLTQGAPLPPNPIVLSFDDGWRNQFIYAFPILQKYHYTATFFVFTNAIDRHGFLTWDNLRVLRDAGMTIGSHTLSHPFLTKITNPDTLWSEINTSKRILEKNLGIPVSEFAYPFGQYNATITALVKQAGYTSARGDYVTRGNTQTREQLYELSALNAPTTIGLFSREFPGNDTTKVRP